MKEREKMLSEISYLQLKIKKPEENEIRLKNTEEELKKSNQQLQASEQQLNQQKQLAEQSREFAESIFDTVRQPLTDKMKDIASLLLLDIKMPKIDGIEVLRKVRQDEKLKTMPIIMITTTDDPREINKCHELGRSNYITKPIKYEKFVEAIRQLGLFLLIVEIPDLNKMN